MSAESGMDGPISGAAGDTAVGMLGATVATLTWLQLITSLEAVVVGALTIVLLCVRIRKHLKG